ncbi:hypothetical protein Vqi01_02090 [Micromonospora qiuiae]|uniref:Uncharacterized protein n=1 Tax=Micromonospora qiuiae TaxID=502268 RepID=A0ABQ4J4F5_9ACTN|nr:hypothetical protein [Micromonospora qiuiae]GIJ25047.1 hypothetical protein Vqi01_02090 [Micromonospora qiuiae]
MILRWLARSGDRAEHERLLDDARGPWAGAPPSGPPDPLAGLLRAAAAPPRPRELAGEEAALAAFRAARQAAAGAPAARPLRRRFTAGVVLWLAGLAATATAGAALAAANLDRTEAPPPPPPASATVAPVPTGVPATPTADRPGGRTPTPTGAPSGAAPAPTSASPVPIEAEPRATAHLGRGNSGRCKAYLSKPERQREKALRTPGFDELVTAAGGAEHVPAYCRQLLAETDPNWLARQEPEPDASTNGTES